MLPALGPALLLLLAALGYLVASGCYCGALALSSRAPGDPPRRDLLAAGLVLVAVAALLHTAAIGARCAQTHRPPFTSAPDALSAVGWAVGIVFLLLQHAPLVRGRAAAPLGALAGSLAFLSVFAGAALRLARPAASAALPSAGARLLDDNLVDLHVLAITFAFGLLAVAVGCALLYLVEDRMLKRKSVAHLLFWSLPPLAVIDTLAFRLVAFAFPLLTLGLVAGIIRAAAAGAAWGGQPQTLASIVTWAAYGAYLWLHARRHWRGPRASALLLAGSAASLATYLAPGTLHQFG